MEIDIHKKYFLPYTYGSSDLRTITILEYRSERPGYSKGFSAIYLFYFDCEGPKYTLSYEEVYLKANLVPYNRASKALYE